MDFILGRARYWIEQGDYDYAYQELRWCLSYANRNPTPINKGKRRYILSAMVAIRRVLRSKQS